MEEEKSDSEEGDRNIIVVSDADELDFDYDMVDESDSANVYSSEDNEDDDKFMNSFIHD